MINVAVIIPMGIPGPWQIAIVVLAIILLFGGKKIPELMRGVGRGMKEFKDAVNTDYSADNGTQSQKKIETTKPEEPEA